MATATHIPAAALGEAFKGDIFSKEVEGWLGRATPADRERFERVFESIRSISEAKKTPDKHAGFVQTTLDKIRQGSSRAPSGSNARTPALARGAPAVVCNGWSYTATRAAFDRPETRTALLSIQESVAVAQEQQQRQQQDAEAAEADRPQSAPTNGRDRELASFQHAAERRRALSFGAPTTPNASSPVGHGHSAFHGADAAAAAAAAVLGTAPQPPPLPPASPIRHQPLETAGSSMTASGFVPISPHVTRYQETYNLRSAYPEVYDAALRDTRVEQPTNSTFISEWGNSLKSGSDEMARMYNRTTYNSLNDEVVKYRTDAEAVREREFFKWMAKQKTFYGDLLTKDKIKDLETLLAGASDEQKHEILATLRTTHAAADFAFDHTRSHSQGVHLPMQRTEDPATEALRRAHNKVRNMGQPIATATVARRAAAAARTRPATAELKPATVNLTLGGPEEGGGGGGGGGGSSVAVVVGGKALKPTRRPATAGAVLGGGGAGGAGAGGVRPVSVPPPQRAEVDKSEMFRSKVPLTWPSGSTGPVISTYEEKYGKPGAGQVRPSSALFRARPIKYNDTSCPYGAVNPITAAAPARSTYPVPESFTSSVAFPLPKGTTSYRTEFAPRDPADLAAQMRAATALAENGRKLLDRGGVPLGTRHGINVLPSAMWISEAHEQYVPFDVDAKERTQAAAAIRAMHQAPTGASGKMTLGGGGGRGGGSARKA
ncbi:hypothetical protein PLESTM_001505300 [Pleodorina starrii]|nr:hypothetical protein PLESTM_001505300 [Pleodorina starrii]